jgi:ubiquitin C-terminal hydrolase
LYLVDKILNENHKAVPKKLQQPPKHGLDYLQAFHGTSNSSVKDLLYGLMRSEVICLTCNGESTSYEPFMGLEVQTKKTLN